MTGLYLPTEAQRAALEKRVNRATLVHDLSFPKQEAFILDPSKRKAALCTRRAGKTNAFVLPFVRDALKYPGRKQIYLGLSKDSAENAFWPELERVLLDRGIKHQYGYVGKLCQFANGSTIQIGGVDASPRDMGKLLGGKPHAAAIDECQDHTQDLRHLINGVLGPAMLDHSLDGGGVIALGGTPGMHLGDHFWWQVTKQLADGSPDPERLKGWSVHQWLISDNPHTAKQFAADLARMELEQGPGFRADPVFRRQYLGQWVLDMDELVYKFNAEKNTIPRDSAIGRLLLSASPTFTYQLSVDLGWEDATAFCVSAYSPSDRHFYVVESQKMNHTTVSAIASHCKDYAAKYSIKRMVIDEGGGSGKLLAESFRSEHGLPVEAADKTNKQAAVARLNSDMIGGRVLAIRETNEALVLEYQKHVVDRRLRALGEWGEPKRHDNHIADAALYAHRMSMHAFGVEPAPEREKDFIDAALQQRQRAKWPARNRRDAAQEALDAHEFVQRWRPNR